jgi:PAS domain S-box-containing protein
LPEALNAEWQLVPARWLAIVVVLLGLPWLPLSPREHTSALLILGFAALFNLGVQRALHRRPGLLASGYLTALGDTLLSLAMVELAGGFESPFSSVFFVVGVSIAMRSSFGPALAMAVLVIAAETLAQGSAAGALAIRGVFLCLTVFFASYVRAQAQRETMQKTAILEQMTDAVLVTDESGRIVLSNPAAETLYGSSRQQLLGTSIETSVGDVFHEPGRDVDLHVLAVSRALRGEPTETEHQIFDAHGVGRWVSASITPLRSIRGRIQGAIAVAHNLTERKLAEEALQASEERFRKQYKGFPLPTYSWLHVGDDFVLQDYNDAAERVTEGRILDSVGTTAAMLYVDQPEILADFQACVAEQHTIRREIHYRYRTGLERELAVTCVFVLPRTVMIHTEDITEAKQAQQHREAMAQSEKLRALGQMASGIAHDLNQSLMLVACYSDLARQALVQDPPDLTELDDLLTTTTQAALDGGETVKRLLLFTRAAPQQDIQPVDLSSVVRETAQLTAPRWRDAAQAAGRPISLHIEATSQPTIQGSPAQLRELLTNLIFNAVDALPTGGTIRLRVAAEDGQGIIEVTDTGVGMSAEVQARVFEPFFTTKGESGTGLGLAMVFGIVEQHGGEIAVRSAPGDGTTFRISFPLATDEMAEAKPATAPARLVPPRPLRILTVDDEPMMTRAVMRMLKPAGHLVSVAASGEEALERLTEEPFDVVVSDMGMGNGMNGWELAEALRLRWPGVRFLLATGWGAAIDPGEAHAKGVEAVLSKPYHPAELLRALARTDQVA